MLARMYGQRRFNKGIRKNFGIVGGKIGAIACECFWVYIDMVQIPGGANHGYNRVYVE